MTMLLVTIGLTAPPANAADSAGPPTTTLNVQPVLKIGNNNCNGGAKGTTAAFPGTIEVRASTIQSGTFSGDGRSVTIAVKTSSQGQYFDFSNVVGTLVGITVKGGNNTNAYDYSGRNATADTFLHAPVNSKRMFYGLSHISFCFSPTTTPPGSPNSELHKAVRNATAGEQFTGPEAPSTTTAKPGDEIEYRLTHHNHGTAAATGVVVTDALPAKTTLVSCTPACGATAGATAPTVLTWSLGEVSVNETNELVFRVKLDATFPAGSTAVDNTGSTKSTQEPSENSNKTTVTVSSASKFDVAKTASVSTAAIGDAVTYTVKVTNIGTSSGSTTAVDDYDEAHLTLTNTGGGTDSAGKLTWGPLTLAAGASQTFTYTGTIKGTFSGTNAPCPTGQYPVVNTVTVTGDTASVTVCVPAKALFDVAKTSSVSTAAVGDAVTYTVKVTNIGTTGGSTTAVDDYDEAHLTLTNTGGGTDSAGKLTWGPLTLAAGASQTFTYTGTIKGTFSGTNAPCPSGQYPVVNTVTVTGDAASVTVCVPAKAVFDVTKTASASTVTVGGSVTYTVKVTNIGAASGSTPVSDDYDQDHLAITSTGGGTDNGDKVSWPSVNLAAGASATYTYTGTIKGTFSGTNAPCPTGQYPVVNNVQVTGDSASVTVCVPAEPKLEVDKTGPATVLESGDEVTFTIAYKNTGSAPTTNAVVTDVLDGATAFVSCTKGGTAGGCTHSGGTVTWNIGTVAAGAGGSVTVTVKVLGSVGCQVCDTASFKADGATTASDTLCLTGAPAANPAGAHASGSALGVSALTRLLGLVNLDVKIAEAESQQAGVGSDFDDATLLTVNLPGVATAKVVGATTTSNVTANPAQARQTSVSRVANVNLVNGLVKADVVQAVASTTARGDGAGFSSAGTTFTGLVVAGKTVAEDVAPGTRITLDPLLFGAGSYVALREEIGSTGRPTAGQLTGGTYTSDLSVSMIRVHITGLIGNSIDVTVAQAKAHSDFPQTALCAPTAKSSVSGHAFIASATVDPPLAQPIVGFVDIPAAGGSQHANLNQTAVGSLAGTGEAVTDSTGTAGPTGSQSTSYAQAAGACVISTATGCAISATAVLSKANSSAGAGGATSNDGDTTLVGLRVLGIPINIDPSPNTEVLDINLDGDPEPEVLLILNEQFCDNGANLANGCSGTPHSGLTVRAARVVLLDPAAGSIPGAEVILAEAHADATFVAP